jgi:hypothetical protein
MHTPLVRETKTPANPLRERPGSVSQFAVRLSANIPAIEPDMPILKPFGSPTVCLVVEGLEELAELSVS